MSILEKIAHLAPDDFRPKYVNAMKKLEETPVKMNLSDLKEELPYVAEAKLFVPTLHLGQRKLFLSELRFLTYLVSNEVNLSDYIVVYAGAGPGVHIPYLYKLFPQLKMLLVDPANFIFPASDAPFYPKYILSADQISYENANCLIINNLMTHEIAKALRKYKTIFISDIRTNDSNDVGAPDIDILWNHYMQFNWIFEMKPEWNMLKFRFPFYNEVELPESSFKDEEFKLAESYAKYINVREQYKKREFMYFDGDAWLQVYPGRRSREMRLVFSNRKKLKLYKNPTQHLALFYYYNCVERGFGTHENDNASEDLGFDLCNDCAQENLIWKKYSNAVKPIIVKDHVRNLGIFLKQPLKQGPHGFLFGPADEKLIAKMMDHEFATAVKLRKEFVSKKISKDRHETISQLLKK